jgi:hypothetical protein
MKKEKKLFYLSKKESQQPLLTLASIKDADAPKANA